MSIPVNRAIYASLSLATKLGPKKVRVLINKYGSIEAAWDKASQVEIGDVRSQIDPVKYYQTLINRGLDTLCWDDEQFPSILKELPDCPYNIYVIGSVSAGLWGVGVVGARKLTEYGKKATEDIVSPLAAAGVPIISGLAIGIDAVAHRACLKSAGQTIAVLGCGLDNIYPSSHTNLAKEIVASGGAVISEYPPGTPALPHHFPVRNRIIAGLSKGVLVVEATLKSGSLLTAQAALEYNREVFTIPHSIYTPTGAGPNNLLKMGARLVTGAQDIFEELKITTDRPSLALAKPKLDRPESKEERLISESLSAGPLHVDRLIETTQLPTARVNATITLMEIKGLIMCLGGNIYQLRN